MQTELIARGRQLTAGARFAIERRIRREFARFSRRIHKVTVRLTDENGPRGGVDAGCLVTVHMEPGGPIVARALALQMTEAASQAVRRAGRTLARRLDRLQSRRKRPDEQP